MRSIALVTICFLAFASPTMAQEAPRVRRDVAYAESGGATSLDVYAPAQGNNLPIMIWVHGGGWRYGDKRNVLVKPAAFNAQGFVFVSINYRLQPGVNYRDQAADVAHAVGWIHAHTAEFGGDPDRIFIMGHSAGAHLAALIACDGRYLKSAGLKLSDLQGVVLLDGAAYDIPRQLELARLPRMKQLYLDAFGADRDKQLDASPITHVAAGKGIPPFLILYVATRRDGRLQSESLAEKLTAAGTSVELLPAKDKTHATISGDLGQPNDPPSEAAFKFLQARLKEPAR
jgi:arylformamidase